METMRRMHQYDRATGERAAMHRLALLVEQMPQIAQPKIEAPGVGIWLAWDGPLPGVIPQTLTEFGGFQQARDDDQALWFFFGEEAFRALARVAGYSRVNRMPVFIQVFPAAMPVGYHYEQSFSCAEGFARQEVQPGQELEILVHPHFRARVEGMTGLTLKPVPPRPGLAPGDYSQLSADIAMGSESPLGWYYMVRPLGDPLDKNQAEGWRAVFSEVQTLLERMAAKYMSHEGYLIFGLDGVKALRTMTRELLALGASLRAPDQGKRYWPCLMACVPKAGNHLNKDLPRRVNLDWKELSPDYPHMSFKSALYLGEGFAINDIRHSSSSLTIDDWCSISLEEQGTGIPKAKPPFSLPANLLAGTNPPCFYCGLSNHQPRECPTRVLHDRDDAIWDRLGMVDMNTLEEAGVLLNQQLSGVSAKTMTGVLDADDDRSLILRGIFEMSFLYQIRGMRRVWLSAGKVLPDGLETLNAASDGEYLWEAIELLRRGDAEGFETEVAPHLSEKGKSFQPRSVQGFMALEQGDWSRAAYFWQEAGRGAYTPLQRAWLFLLEGRAMEVQGDYSKAMALYRQAKSECPRWNEPDYRQGVCMVKQGFTDQGMHIFLDLLRADPNIFNRILLDPELERGRIHLQAALSGPWNEAKALRDDKSDTLANLPAYLHSWFKDGHPFLEKGLSRAERLGAMAKVANYVCFHRVVSEYDALQSDLRQTVDKATKALNARLKEIHDELKDIHHEAAWFPFTKLLREFNKDYNSCASKLNWMRTTPLNVAANFRKSQDYVEDIDATIVLLRARLVTLRIVRDVTLFLMLLGKTFMWLEIIGLALSLVLVPTLVYLAQKTGQNWIAWTLSSQQWQMQKALVLMVSIGAMAFAAMRTALTFEKKRAALFKAGEEASGKSGGKRSKAATGAKPGKAPSGGKSGKEAAKALPQGKGARKA